MITDRLESQQASKDGIFQFGNGPSNVEFKVELDAGTEAQLPATRPPVNDSVVSESQPYSLNLVRSLGGVAEDVYVPKLIEKIENNLNVIRGLHQRSLGEFDSPVGASRTSSVSHELHYYGTSTRFLCLQLTRYFQNSGPRTAQQLEGVRSAQAIIKQYQNVISDSVGSIRVQMEEQYRLVRPEATDQDIAEALKDVPSRNVSVLVSRLSPSKGRQTNLMTESEELIRSHRSIYAVYMTERPFDPSFAPSRGDHACLTSWRRACKSSMNCMALYCEPTE